MATSIAFMSKKRSLTEAEVAAARALADAIAVSGLTQDFLAAQLDVTQGLIWQWANAKLRVPAHHAPPLAALLKVDPEKISPAYADMQAKAKAVREQPATYRTDRPALTPEGRIRGDVDALRIAVAGIVEWIIETAPAKAGVLRDALTSAVENPKDLRRGFLGQLLHSLDEALPSTEAAPAHSRRRAAS